LWIKRNWGDFEFRIFNFEFMDKAELQNRTKRFAIDIIKFVGELPSNKAVNVLSNQLLRSSTSIGANYRSACKGKSTADFINKIVIVEEEADESIYWLELMEESGLIQSDNLPALRKEARELTAIFTAIGKTAKENQRNLKKS
jgi:four helix bundle protein